MKLFARVVGSMLTIAALLQLTQVTGWDIVASDAVPLTSGGHDTLAKTWTVTGNETTLRHLSVFATSRVFVDYDPSLASSDPSSRVVAKVVFSGNNQAVLDAYEVVNDDNSTEGINVRFRNIDFEDKGYLLTQIYVADKQSISQLSQLWSADMVVGDDVLIQNEPTANLTLAVVGSGDLYAGSPETEYKLASLGAVVVGSGDIQLLAKSVKTSSVLSLDVVGSGDVALVADTVNVDDVLLTVVASSGDVHLQTDNLVAYNLTTIVAGSGSVTYAREGTCTEQTINVVGSGDVAAGSIKCTNTNITLVARTNSDVVVQTTDTLTVTTLFSSSGVRYYGPKPRVIDVVTGFGFFGKRRTIKRTKKNQYDEYEIETPPSRTSVFVAVKTEQAPTGNTPTIKSLVETDEEDDYAVQAVQMHAVQQSTSSLVVIRPHHFRGFFLTGFAFAAVGFAWKKYKRCKRQARYHSLV